MSRFFLDPRYIRSETVHIAGEAFHHLRVLRARTGEHVEVVPWCDEAPAPAESVLLVELTRIEPGRALGRIIERRRPAPEPDLKVHLAQAVPKGDKMDFIVQKCTELGVTSITPLCTERTVVRLQGRRAEERRARWQKIAAAAAAQSRRAFIPRIRPVVSWDDFLVRTRAGGGLRIIAWEDETARGLDEVLDRWNGGDVSLAVGPEGGFPLEEVSGAVRAGFLPASLGPRFLKAETASILSVGLALFVLGDLGKAPRFRGVATNGQPPSSHE